MVKEKIEYYFNMFITWVRDNKRKFASTLVIILILCSAFAMRFFSNASELEVEETSEQAVTLYVDISGAVKKPGVYELEDVTRLYELIELAGGLESYADIDSINQAEFVEDGQKIFIPSKEEEASEDANATAQSRQGNETMSLDGKINLNIASKDELKSLSGIGDVIADRIIEYRNTNRFKSIEEIKNVKGIGNSIFEKIKENIKV